MNIETAISLIKSGKFFTAEFTKKDGTSRRIHARSGVRKYVKGTGMAWSPSDRGYLSVYDLQKKEYRLINTQTITKVNGNEIQYGR